MALVVVEPSDLRPPKSEREELFLCSKLWAADVEDVPGAFDRSLANLGTDVLDLYFVHWPGSWGVECGSNAELRVRTWRQMELLLDSGRARSIGASARQPSTDEACHSAEEPAHLAELVGG